MKKQAKGRTQPVKSFLMDNKNVVGIGNIYACETLFESQVNPKQPAGSISLSRWKRVVDCSKEVLARAIASGGSTISDFIGSDGKKGYFQLSLKVYGRESQPCSVCNDFILKEKISGRATFFCKKCQKLR